MGSDNLLAKVQSKTQSGQLFRLHANRLKLTSRKPSSPASRAKLSVVPPPILKTPIILWDEDIDLKPKRDQKVRSTITKDSDPKNEESEK